MINNPIICKFFKDCANHRTKTNRVVDLSPTFVNTGTTDETFQQCGKQDFLKLVSAIFYENFFSPNDSPLKTDIQICVFSSSHVFLPVSHCLQVDPRKVYGVINGLNKNLITHFV